MISPTQIKQWEELAGKFLGNWDIHGIGRVNTALPALLEERRKLMEALEEVQRFAENGQIENYDILSDRIDNILTRSDGE